MALAKKGSFGLNLEEQFKNAPRVTDVEPVDTHTDKHADAHTDADTHAHADTDTHTYTDTDAHAHADKHTDADTDTDTDAEKDAHTHTYPHEYAALEQENKTKRTYGLVQQTVFDKITAYAKANKTSYNAIVCDLLEEFIREKGL